MKTIVHGWIGWAAIGLAIATYHPLDAQENRPGRDSVSADIVGRTENSRVVISWWVDHLELGVPAPRRPGWMPGTVGVTRLTTTATLEIGPLSVPRGAYSLWTLPTRDGTALVVNRGVGDSALSYDSTQDAGRVALAADTLHVPVDGLSIRIRAQRNGPDTITSRFDVSRSSPNLDHYTVGLLPGSTWELVIVWGRVRWSVPMKAR